MPSHPYRESGGVRGIVLISCWVIGVMTPSQSGKDCVPATSCLGSPSETQNMAVD
jgi:hypothetical protein